MPFFTELAHVSGFGWENGQGIFDETYLFFRP